MTTWATWAVLAVAAAAAFVIDQRLHRDPTTQPTLRRSAVDTFGWTVVGLAFAGVVWALHGGGAAMDYVTGYTLEKSLSLDNVAVFAVIIASLAIPPARQRRVIDHAILAALGLRVAFIAGGLALLEQVHLVLYLFGAILIVSGLRMFRAEDEAPGDGPPRIVTLAQRFVPIAEGDHGNRYLVASGNGRRRRATTLLVALFALAVVDVVFAVDSVPAIFSVTHDAWVVTAANAFALLGMRPMYFLLAEGIDRLAHLRRGLAVILVGIGVNLVIEEHVAIPTIATLAFVVVVLGLSVAISLHERRREALGSVGTTTERRSGQAQPRDRATREDQDVTPELGG
ncbi:MAG TPA: TerC/Alx family metal homeostasis membrane protein [Mycobacteriales bacterium]|jgi:tellurite resistance protein TerC|nr:TerC/Alx family metal homeostasis membrane protein [Mycobacteriales bacterium]